MTSFRRRDAGTDFEDVEETGEQVEEGAARNREPISSVPVARRMG